MTFNRQNAGGTAAALAISGLASQLVPTPPDMVAVFTVTAVGSGATGYWISRAEYFNTIGIKGRVIIGGLVVALLVLLSYVYMVYYHLSAPSALQDIFGFLAFGVMFVTVCFVLGVLQIEVFRPGSDSPNLGGGS